MYTKNVKWILLLSVILLVFLHSFAVAENEVTLVASGKCGTNVVWELESNGTLSITGSGMMKDYTYSSYAPWYSSYKTAIKSVVIDGEITNIGSYSFYSCSNLEKITIPNSVTSIGNYAFSYCSGLTNLSIPDNVLTIGKSAFGDCTNLTELTIPESVTDIDTYAFVNCSNLTTITMSNKPTNIGVGIFYGCSNLTHVEIPQSMV